MKRHHISIRQLPGLLSVDISDSPHRGGFCRCFKFLGDALIWIKEVTGKDIPSNWNLKTIAPGNDFTADL